MTIRRRANQVAGATIAALLVWYTISLGLDIRGVRKMCSEIVTGSSIEAARAIITKFGFSRYADQKADFGVSTSGGTYSWLVPSGMAMGDFVCVISHDGSMVLTATMSEP